MTRLPFFKFNPSVWLTGDITMESFNVQGVFINICAYYWQRECTINEAWLKQRLSGASTEIEVLIQKGFLSRKNDNGDLTINFLNEQHSELTKLSETRVSAGRKGGQASVKQRLKNTQANLKHLKEDTDKEQEYKGKKFIPPTLEEVKEHFKKEGYMEEIAIKAFYGYSEANWIDSHGKPVLNWKQKMRFVWFKEEHKIPSNIPKMHY